MSVCHLWIRPSYLTQSVGHWELLEKKIVTHARNVKVRRGCWKEERMFVKSKRRLSHHTVCYFHANSLIFKIYYSSALLCTYMLYYEKSIRLNHSTLPWTVWAQLIWYHSQCFHRFRYLFCCRLTLFHYLWYHSSMSECFQDCGARAREKDPRSQGKTI